MLNVSLIMIVMVTIMMMVMMMIMMMMMMTMTKATRINGKVTGDFDDGGGRQIHGNGGGDEDV